MPIVNKNRYFLETAKQYLASTTKGAIKIMVTM